MVRARMGYYHVLISATTKETKKIHGDDAPIVTFFKIDDGNEEFLKWIEENIR